MMMLVVGRRRMTDLEELRLVYVMLLESKLEMVEKSLKGIGNGKKDVQKDKRYIRNTNCGD